MLIADKGYAHDSTRRALRQRGIRHGLKQWRDLATRYAKRASLYRSSLALIAAVIRLR
ncbi:transposase [Micromonospora jinlongensis]|uniref:Transposase n=1 Tax=Micromonospora jinlongensis TaxID=1287877 RepID=A0A7Y9WXZ2_9ACTN|nr:transposase [Micromonospora jinlongensis]